MTKMNIDLNEIARITRGAPKGRLEDSRDESVEVAVVQPVNLGPLGLEGELSVATVARYKMETYRLKGGEVLISLLDPPDALLRVGLVTSDTPFAAAGWLFSGPRDLVAGANVAIIRLHTDQLDVQFLALYLRSQAAARQLRAVRAGSVQSYLNIAALGRVRIPIPPLEEQRRAAHLHESYERYAQETNRLLHAERQLMQASFDRWFRTTGG